MKAKPTILVIENSIDVTGALKSVTLAAFNLRSAYNFHFIIPRHSKGRFWLEEKGFKNIHEMPMKEISRRFSSLLCYIPQLVINAIRLQRILRKQGILLIHVNDLYNLLPVVLHFFGSKVPYVCYIRFLPDRFPKALFTFWLRLHLRYADKVIAVSKSVMERLPGHEKLVIIYDELPMEESHPDLSSIEKTKTDFTFLYLSNFMQGKGQDYALEAFEKIHEQLIGWKLRFVGGDMGLQKNKDYITSLKAKAVLFGLDQKIEWVGFTKEVEEEYKQADIVLNFSESESFSMTCLEALFFGCPLIATDCGGPTEIIDHMQTGISIPNKNVKAMSDAMLMLAQHESIRKQFSKKAKVMVQRKFGTENTSLKLQEVYKKILNES